MTLAHHQSWADFQPRYWQRTPLPGDRPPGWGWVVLVILLGLSAACVWAALS